MKAKKKKAGSSRRLGVEHSETRGQLIDAAASIIRKEGYAAVTARRLAEEIGLKRVIVHYYFRTIEDLFIAVMRREAASVQLVLAETMASKEPLRAIWDRSRNATAIFLEFIALANRSKGIQAEVKRYLEEFRSIQTQALARHMELRGVKSKVPPVAMIFVLHSLIQSLAIETSLDVSDGHPEVVALIEGNLRAFEKQGKALAGGGRKRPRRKSS